MISVFHLPLLSSRRPLKNSNTLVLVPAWFVISLIGFLFLREHTSHVFGMLFTEVIKFHSSDSFLLSRSYEIFCCRVMCTGKTAVRTAGSGTGNAGWVLASPLPERLTDLLRAGVYKDDGNWE